LLETLQPGPDALEVTKSLAALLEKLDQPERAVRVLEDIAQRDSLAPALVDQLASLYERSERWADLADFFAAQAEKAEGTRARDLLLRAADLQSERLSAPDHAADLLQRAVGFAPDDRTLLLRLCDLLEAAGRHREAADTLQKVVDSYGGRRSRDLSEVHQRLARAYRREGELTRAIQELDAAFRIEPGNVLVLRDLGALALEQGDLKKAQQMYRALLLQRLEIGSPISKAEVFCALGKVHQHLGESDKARKMLERALQTDPSLAEAQQIFASLN
jgi:golgin subfamily B member 1